MWKVSPPTPSLMGDHDVPSLGEHLAGKNIALLISGGIAAMRAPLIARHLRRYGASITAYVSKDALNYTTKMALEWATLSPVVSDLTSASEHLHKDKPFDAYLVAPATYNTINKFAVGVADTVLTTTLASALGLLEKGKTKILIVPTMHGDMHNSILEENVRRLQSKGVVFIPPRDAYGKHNIPENEEIVSALIRTLSVSPLRGVPVLVTGGPTPVPLDRVRIITNVFKGVLGTQIAEELWLRGADVHFILGRGLVKVNPYIPTTIIQNYAEYQRAVSTRLADKAYPFGVFCAAVADYQPKQAFDGKMPSGEAEKKIDLVPTKKIVDEVIHSFPTTKVISFKLEVGKGKNEFAQIAAERMKRGHFAVVANEFSEVRNDSHRAFLFSRDADPIEMADKNEIAAQVANLIERSLPSAR